ncbi:MULTISPECIES: hypothetical protein [Microbacterium]|uniref:Uncharacterized protein n=1 Tax=Microbacterium wangchenii TaxID=2541726 RepID=A0ABX5SXL3_9MICO|nr:MULTISPECIES: hypothetical protein [Microbacterium]MCK6067501.1 hypothetical protein [Microbacterium sp. EYE_512]QBR89569.1 hypothetical protein E4K62_13305 [Microbacterium wangchenii]TXK16833.1 hypothetical protein FVP99_09210 [Microbacterium wangchenii]
MEKRPPAEARALAALPEVAEAVRAARKTAKRIDDKPARDLRKRAARVEALAAAAGEGAEHPNQARRKTVKAAAALRDATHDALRAQVARELARAEGTQQRVRAAMTESGPVVSTVPAARDTGVPPLVRPEDVRRRQTLGS